MSILADLILRDIREGNPFEPRENAITSLDMAYGIQREVTAALLGDQPGRRIAGYKIAFNRSSSMTYYGLGEPCYAPLFSDQVQSSAVTLPLASFRDLVVEPEIALRLGTSRAVDAWMPAVEIMDLRGAFSRDPSAAAAVAQRIHGEGAVLGPAVQPGRIEMEEITARLRVGDAIVGEAKGGAPQDPRDALAWLAGRLAKDGQPLEAGMVVLTGAHLPGQAVTEPCRIEASFGRLGAVSLDLV